MFIYIHCLSWEGFSQFSNFLFLLFHVTSKLNEQSSEFRGDSKKRCNVKVFDYAKIENYRSARRNLLDEDSAYDKLVPSFSPSLSMERGYKSENSDSKINTDTECPREENKCK